MSLGKINLTVLWWMDWSSEITLGEEIEILNQSSLFENQKGRQKYCRVQIGMLAERMLVLVNEKGNLARKSSNE